MQIKKLIHTVLNGMGLLIITVALTIIMKVFLFASFKIPTPSMAPAIMDGDWIFDSVDFRYWGLLPDDLVIGKATLIWKSLDLQIRNILWNRFFKTIK